MVDAELPAYGDERALLRGVRPLCVGAERVGSGRSARWQNLRADEVVARHNRHTCEMVSHLWVRVLPACYDVLVLVQLGPGQEVS